MEGLEKAKVLFIAGFGPIVRDVRRQPQIVRWDPGHPLQRRGRRLSAHGCSAGSEELRSLASLAGSAVLFWQ